MQPKRLHTYTWKGINKNNTVVTGKASDYSPAAMQEKLQQQGIELIYLKKKPSFFFNFNHIKFHEIVLLSRHLATMISAELSLVQSLDIVLKSQHNNALVTLLRDIKESIVSGKSFHDALAKHPKYFDKLFVQLVRVGELSGTLDVMLQRLAIHHEKIFFLKKRIKKALYYPITVLGISAVVTVVLLTFVIPEFKNIFQSFGGELPLFTKIIIQLSEWSRLYGLGIGAIMSLLISISSYAIKNYSGVNYLFDRVLLKLPLLGPLINKMIIAIVARSLATMLAAGLPFLDALAIASSVTNNSVFSSAFKRLHHDVTSGQAINISMGALKIFPTMMVSLVAVGEESATLPTMLDKIATFYEEDIDNTVNGVTTMLDPIIILILAAIIGTFVLAMYLPIFKLGSIV